jgi:hypothetical protein
MCFLLPHFLFSDFCLVVAAALFFSLIAAAAWFDHGGWLDYGWAFVMVAVRHSAMAR